MFYSYSTCNSTAAEWTDHLSRRGQLGGIKIQAGENLSASPLLGNHSHSYAFIHSSLFTPVIPTYVAPMLYKSDPINGDIISSPGSEYYDDTVPFEGVSVNYVQSLQEVGASTFGIV